MFISLCIKFYNDLNSKYLHAEDERSLIKKPKIISLEQTDHHRNTYILYLDKVIC